MVAFRSASIVLAGAAALSGAVALPAAGAGSTVYPATTPLAQINATVNGAPIFHEHNQATGDKDETKGTKPTTSTGTTSSTNPEISRGASTNNDRGSSDFIANNDNGTNGNNAIENPNIHHGRRLWKGLLGRGPWRYDEPIINVDLDNADNTQPNHPVGQLLNIDKRHHRHDDDHQDHHHRRHSTDVIVVDGHRHHHSGVTVVKDRELGIGKHMSRSARLPPPLPSPSSGSPTAFQPEAFGLDADIIATAKRSPSPHEEVIITGHHGSTIVIDKHHRTTVVTTRSPHHHDNDKTVIVDHGHHRRGEEEMENRHSHDHRRHGDDITVVHKRDADTGPQMDGAPGYIDVASSGVNSTTSKIASLVLSTTNTTSPVNSTFVLNASNNIKTQVYLVPVMNGTLPSSSNSTTSSGPIEVRLKLPVFVAATASVEPYCATFDPNPVTAEPITVTPCMNETTTHASQLFLYDPSSGVVQPDWSPSTVAQQLLQGTADAVDNTAVDPNASASDTAPDTASSTMMSSVTSTSPGTVPFSDMSYTSYTYSISASPSASGPVSEMSAITSASAASTSSLSTTTAASASASASASIPVSASSTASSSGMASGSSDPFLNQAELPVITAVASVPTAPLSVAVSVTSAADGILGAVGSALDSVTPAPVASVTGTVGSAALGAASAIPSANPPALNTTGDSVSTASSSLSATNITLIFTPSNPSVTTSDSVNPVGSDETAYAQLG